MAAGENVQFQFYQFIPPVSLTSINSCRPRCRFYFSRDRETCPVAIRWFDVSPRPNVRHGQEISMQDSMRMLLRAGTLALTLVGGVGLAVGQNAPSDAGGQEKPNLRQSKEQMVSQGLKSEPAQSCPATREKSAPSLRIR
jgi:hypothetical protein